MRANEGLILLKQAGLLRSENTTLSKKPAITTEAQLRETARALLTEDAVFGITLGAEGGQNGTIADDLTGQGFKTRQDWAVCTLVREDATLR